MVTAAEEYRRLRRKNPGLPAKQAVLWARGNVKPSTLDWTLYEGSHVAVGRTTRDGFEVRVIIDYDTDTYGRVEETDTDTGIRNPRFGQRWTGDSWDTRNVRRYLSLESDSTVKELASYYHKAGASKNVAWEEARESLQEEAERYLSDDHAEYVIHAKAYLDGVPMGESGYVGGYEVDDRESFEKQLDDFAHETDCIDEVIEEARAKVRALDVKIHASGVLTPA